MISSQIFTHSWTLFACYNMDGIRNGRYGWGLGCMGGMIPLLILAYKHIKFRFHQDRFLHNEYSPKPNPQCRQLLTLLAILLAIQDCPVSRKRLRQPLLFQDFVITSIKLILNPLNANLILGSTDWELYDGNFGV